MAECVATTESGGPLVRAAILLGSNIEPERHLPAAVRELAAMGTGFTVSQVWQTAPVGFTDQADFCNAAVVMEIRIAADELRSRLRDVEHRLGRVRDPANKNAPRTIDLDLGFLLNRDGMTGDHDPAIWERVFLAVPLAEVVPGVHNPATGESIKGAAERLHARDGAALRLSLRADLRLG
jgi:2-amino-4-hydroxy-6-hydroxymethyldihydropteridine diphosphokinase